MSIHTIDENPSNSTCASPFSIVVVKVVDASEDPLDGIAVIVVTLRLNESVGRDVGINDGFDDGSIDGCDVGESVGLLDDGSADGAVDGMSVGLWDPKLSS